ncbi:Hydin [Trypanosoma vivax]|nr:Hydin [Trypanosoma vivax]
MHHGRRAVSASGATEDATTAGANICSAATSIRLPRRMAFEVVPQEIVIRDFKVHETYEVNVTLKNTSKETQFVRVKQPPSRFITVKLARHNADTTKVAMGLSVTYTICFKAEEDRDYKCDIVVITNREEFTIPLRAVANRGCLEFPDNFTVSPSPVKGSAATTLFIRNPGKSPCQWRAECSGPFAIEPSSGVVPPQGTISPVSVIFAPTQLQMYSSSIIFFLGPDEDVVKELPVKGHAIEIPIALEQSLISFPDTFVTLENQMVVRVKNESDFTVNFTWKSERTEKNEAHAMSSKLLEQAEAVKYAVVTNSSHPIIQKRVAKEHTTILTGNGRVFDDDVFTIEPLSGSIYGRGYRDFVITFNPQLTLDYFATAYLDISGRYQRMPLQMKGRGLGPQCELEFTNLEIGDIVVGAVHVYKVCIKNKGCIEGRFMVMPQDTLMGRKFTFSPSEGVLAPGESDEFVIRLESDLLGLIVETFNIRIHGTLNDLTLRFRGRVTSPSLRFNKNFLDFGNVSYDTFHSSVVQMTNTGELPIQYRLHIPDSSPLFSSITVTPYSGLIQKGESCDVRVDLTSNILGDVETQLLVDMEGVGEAVHALPIKLNCLVPTLSLSQEQLHYGACFVGNEYTMNLQVVNRTALLGKFTVILLDEEEVNAARAVLVIGSSEEPNAIETINPRGRTLVPVKLTPRVVGELRMTLYVRVLGSAEPPLPVIVTASARGPVVTVEPQTISFGSVCLLEEVERELVICNTSNTPAYFTVNLVSNGERNGTPVFFLEPEEGEISPEGRTTVKVKAMLDVARCFKSKIQVTVRHAEKNAHVVDVTAHGKGYALVPAEPIDNIDFGDVFTKTLVEKKIVILNKGRRDVEVMWSCSGRMRSKGSTSPPAFVIKPDITTIPARESCAFFVQAMAETKGEYVEDFVLKEKRVYKPIISANISGNFITPLVTYSPTKVVFSYVYGAEGEEGRVVTTKTFTMKNTCSRALQVTLTCVDSSSSKCSPFTLENPTTFTLASGETHIVGINCDAMYRGDNIAHSRKSYVLVAFSNHPLTERVPLYVNIALPAISISPDLPQVNFGSILADTEKRVELTLTNTSTVVAANFLWSIENIKGATKSVSMKQGVMLEDRDQEEHTEQQLTRKHFDIVPFRGTIPPGGKKTVEAVFYGSRGRREAVAKCRLEGGPSYDVSLIGWSDVTVRFNCTSLDFGVMHYREEAQKTICITSPSHVAVPFTVDLSSIKQPGSVTVRPLRGTVTHKVLIYVTFTPMVPDEVVETFAVQVGHLDPQVIKVRGLGQVAAVSVTMKDDGAQFRRVVDPVYADILRGLQCNEWIPYHLKCGKSVEIPNVIPIEVEAERLALCSSILGIREPILDIYDPLTTSFGVDGEKTTDERPILARYIIDFGNITRQEPQTASILLTNTSVFPAPVQLDKQALEDLPLLLEPIKLSTIQPFAHTELSITLVNADQDKITNGANKFEFSLTMCKGPQIIIEVRCFLATPVLTPETDVVDFGDIVLGHISVKNIRFMNCETVPCTWKIKLVESKRREDPQNISTALLVGGSRKQFRINKEKGTLTPNSEMCIRVSFSSYYIGPAKAKLHLRFVSNPEERVVLVKGNVVGINIELCPQPLRFPPAFPCQVVKQTFTVTNNEDRPVEIFCKNYDQRYKVETTALRHALAMESETRGPSSELYLPVRQAGDYLPIDMLETVFDCLQVEETAMESSCKSGLLDRLADDPRSSHSTIKGVPSHNSPTTPTREITSCEVTLSKESQSKSNTQGLKTKVYVITGPPCAGKTTQTQRLLRGGSVIQLDLNAMVRAEAEFDTAEGESIRGILAQKEKGSTNPADLVSNNENSKTNPLMMLANSKVVIVLHTLIVRYLSKIENASPVVIDDVKCILTDDYEAVLFAIEKAVHAKGLSLHVISLGVSEATIGLRHNLDIQRKCQVRTDAASLKLLTEEEYEELTEEERNTYNLRLLYFNKCKLELAEATKEVLHYSAESEKVGQVTVQQAIDLEIAAKEEQEALIRMSSKGRKYVPEPRPKPTWAHLSDSDRYKELYYILRNNSDIEHIVIDGNDCEEALDKMLVATQHTNEIQTKENTALEAVEDLRPKNYFSLGDDDGVWELITGEQLGEEHVSYEDFRLFSTVEREFAAKKAPKNTSLTVMTAMEETARWLLQPHSSVTVTIVFCSNKAEEDVKTLSFGITGTSQELFVPVQTCTAYPEINRDERSIFSNTKTRVVAGRPQNKVYLASKRTYEFGPLIVQTCSSSGSSQKRVASFRFSDPSVHRKDSNLIQDSVFQDTLTFTNTGIFPAEITLSFSKDKDCTFWVHPNKFTLAVGEKTSVLLRAMPETIGEITSSLILTIRDNPVPWFVNVSCIGTRPAITLDGKKELLLQYGRSLIMRQVDKVVTIANVSSMPVLWRIAGTTKLPSEFEVNVTKGVLEVNGVQTLEVSFKPTRPGVYNVPLKIEVLDMDETLFESLPLTIKGESHDAVLEWTRQVDFKMMHVGDTKKEYIRILNKSTNDVGFMLRLPKALQNLITITPSEGILRGLVGYKDAALAAIEVSIRFEKEGEIPPLLGVIEASFYDPTSNELLYPLQSISVSGEAWYNKFSIRPSCIDFGPCVTNQKKQTTFELRNTGKFPLTYRLFSYKNGPHGSVVDTDLSSKRSRKSNKVETGFQLGVFTVSPSTGTVPVGECCVFNVSTLLQERGDQREVLGIHVNHCEPEIDKKGVPFELVAIPTTPGIVADLTTSLGVDTVFEEQQIVSSLSSFNSPMRVFAREECVFSFGKSLVGGRVDERFRIANSCSLTCTVKLRLLPKATSEQKDKKERRDKNMPITADGFKFLIDGELCDDGTLLLSSFESRFVTVCFVPHALQAFSGRFEAVAVGGTNPTTNVLRFDLFGEGVLPSVEYILPPRLQLISSALMLAPATSNMKGKGRDARKNMGARQSIHEVANSLPGDYIEFPLTLVGLVSSRTFTVRNVSDIDVHLRITTPDESQKDVTVSKLKENIVLYPGTEEVVTLTYAPTTVSRWKMRLRVALTENPFDDREIWVGGESFFNAVSFDKIDPTTEDKLTLGYWYPAHPKEHTFTVRNNMQSTIRFEWAHSSRVLTFSPSIGYIAAGSVKSVKIRLYSENISRDNVPCTMHFSAIETDHVEWDNSQVRERWQLDAHADEEDLNATVDEEWTTGFQKVAGPVVEPRYTVIDKTKSHKMLYVTYACEPATYKITLPMNEVPDAFNDITFPTTKILQKRFTTLRIENLGLNVLPFSFEVMSGEVGTPVVADLSGAFIVDPPSGEVGPRTHRDVRVTFAPKTLDPVTRLLLFKAPRSSVSEQRITLRGTAECPMIHINVPPCDYLNTRIEGEAGDHILPETIPVMFEACGLNTKTLVSFKVINPTTTTYRYEWLCDETTRQLCPFRCLTPAGSISPGKQCEMTFEYVSTSLATRESLWNFFITGQMAVSFLLVGRAYEPNVFLNVSKVYFGGTIVGNKNERVITMENREDIAIPFSFEYGVTSIDRSCVGVKPRAGVIQPKSKLSLTVWFCPNEEVAVNMRLLCRLKRSSNPLTINLKGEGLRVHSSMSIEEGDVNDPTMPINVPSFQAYYYNFGRVQVNTTINKRFIISNDGECSFDYSIIAAEHRSFVISPLGGTLESRQRGEVVVTYSPTTDEVLRNFTIQCKIDKRIVYTVRLSATSYTPKLCLGFHSYNFGPCFISDYTNNQPAVATLSLLNGETSESLTVDCLLFKDNIFELDASSFVLSPTETRVVKVFFNPFEVGEFTNELKLLVNGSHPMFVTLQGEGIIPRVEASSKFIRLGVARIGERRVADIRLECKSRAPVTVSLANSIDRQLAAKGISFSPNDVFVMKPGESKTVTAAFKPTARMSEFQHEVRMTVCGREIPFAILSAACEDAEVHLDVHNVLFDSVIVGVVATKRVVIMNSGDLSQRFTWDASATTDGELKVVPSSGVVRAHAEQACEIIFAPSKVGTSIHRAITVEFDNAQPLSVNVEAHGVDLPDADAVLQFSCVVRTTVTKTVSIENPSSSVWTLRPTVDNRIWSTPKILTVNPKSHVQLPITYSPFIQTKEKDMGKLFLPLPSGDARVFQLEGTAVSALDGGSMQEKVIETNTVHTETFELQNSTNSTLRFRASVTWVNEPEKGIALVKAPITVDVPAKQCKEIAVNITVMKECVLNGTVLFRCLEREEHSQEFNVALRVVPKAVSTITELVAAVRTAGVYRLAIKNTLAKPVTFTNRVENALDVVTVDPHITVGPKSTVELPIKFFPLVHKDYPVAVVTATSAELGNITCKLHLRSTPPRAEKVIRISCPLGQCVEFPLTFTSYSKVNCDFSVSITGEGKITPFSKVGNSSNVKVPACVRPEGQEVTVEMMYEPCSEGCVKGMIEICSPIAGTYIFPVLATCLPPQRQGPFPVRTGQTTTISFKNVFSETITLSISTDSPNFVVAKSTEVVQPKKSVAIQVQNKVIEESRDAHTAKLTVSTVNNGETLRWVYYLKNVANELPTFPSTTPRSR